MVTNESGTRTDVASVKLKVEKIDDGWRFTGNKFWITNKPVTSTLVVHAKTSPKKGSKGITTLIIEKGILDALGRDACVHPVYLVSLTAIIVKRCSRDSQQSNNRLHAWTLGTLSLSRGPLGTMQTIFGCAPDYIHEYCQFDQPIGTSKLIQGKATDTHTKLATPPVRRREENGSYIPGRVHHLSRHRPPVSL